MSETKQRQICNSDIKTLFRNSYDTDRSTQASEIQENKSIIVNNIAKLVIILTGI